MGNKEIAKIRKQAAEKAFAKRRNIDAGIHGQITIKLDRIEKEVEALRKIAKKLKY